MDNYYPYHPYPVQLSIWNIVNLWVGANPLEVEILSLESQRICNIIAVAIEQGEMPYLDNKGNLHTPPLLVILEAIKIKYYDNMPMVIYSKLNVNFLMDAFLIREIEARAILTILKCDFGTPKQRQRKTVEWKKDYSTELLNQLYHIRLYDFATKSIKDQPTIKQLQAKYSNKNKPHGQFIGDLGFYQVYVSNRNIEAIWQILSHPSKKRNKK
jgi:hypothetical protein